MTNQETNFETLNHKAAIEALKSRVNIRAMMKDQNLSVYDLKDMVSRLNQVIGTIENEVILEDVQTAIKSLLKLGVAVPKELAEKEASLIKNYFPEVTPLSPTKVKVSSNAGGKGKHERPLGTFTYGDLTVYAKNTKRITTKIRPVYDAWCKDNPLVDGDEQQQKQHKEDFFKACFTKTNTQ
ncbi:hypothetical protein NDZ80_001603 [Vibrio vulnificus]|nr:hypothetical protein [Vibrio vulnificus]